MLCSISFIRWPYAFISYFTQLTLARSLTPSMHYTLVWGPFYQSLVATGHFKGIWPLVDLGWPVHDLWPQQYITLWSWVLPTKFGGHRAFLSNLTLVDPWWPLHDLWPQQCITLWPGVLPTKFGGHRALLSKLTPTWPQLAPTWPLTPAMHYILVRGSFHQIWWP